MKYTLLFAPLLASTAWAQAEDVYKTLSLGDRVQITFRSGSTITGQLVRSRIGQPVKPPGPGAEEAVDYTKETGLTVDLSWEYPGLDGTMTILRKEIKDVKKLQSLDKETMERLKRQKEEIRKDLERQNADNKAKAAVKDREAEAERLKLEEEKRKEAELKGTADADKDKLKRAEEGLKLLQKFPPEAGWGPDKLKEISLKTQRKAAPITLDETEFMQNFPLWSEAKTAMDKAKKATENK